MEHHTIGEIAKRVGVGVETVRFYERQGLVPEPPRSPSGYRLYPPETTDRLRFVRRARELGFTLDEIGVLLDLRVTPGSACESVRALAEDKLADIEHRIADLTRIAEVLRRLVASCEAGRPEVGCPILDALDEAIR